MRSFFLMLVAIIIITVVSAPLIALKAFYKRYKKESVSDYLKIIAVGFDQVGGSILYSQEDWTVSSWTYHLSLTSKRAYYFMLFINLLFGKDHCYNSWQWECSTNAQNLQEGMQ